MLLTVSSFLIVTALVAYISWLRTKNDDLTTSKGYFLAGRGLSGIVNWLLNGFNFTFY